MKVAFSAMRFGDNRSSLPSLSASSAYYRGDFTAGVRDVWWNTRIKSAADVPIEICDFEAQSVSLFIVHQRTEAGFIAPIGFLIQSEPLIIATHPVGEIFLSGVVAIGITGPVTVLVSNAELNTVMRIPLRRYALIQRRRQSEQKNCGNDCVFEPVKLFFHLSPPSVVA